jgi:PLD-like domain
MDVRLVDRDWREELAVCYERSPTGLRIICPFVKRDALRRVIGDRATGDARLITRFDLNGFAAGVSDISALMDVLGAGGEVRGKGGLHSKVFIFGDLVAAVTSANLTRKGLESNAEFGCISELSEFVAACQAYFDSLWAISGPSVSRAQLEEWQGQVVRFLASGARPGTRGALPDYGADAGDVVPTPIPVSDEASDAIGNITPTWITEARQAQIKILGEADDRVKWSQPVLEQLKASGSHWACTYPRRKGRPRNVQDGDAMYMARMVEEPNDYLIYGRAAALAHVDDRDVATPAEIEARPWKERYPYYIRVHDGEFVAGALSNGIPLSQLREELRADAFATTQEHALAGSGNTNPSLSLMQQPAVRLSQDGLAWLTGRFDQALQRNGRLPAEDLNELDWPTPGCVR